MKEQLHNKSEKSKRTRKYFAKTSNFYTLLILQNKTENDDKRCKFTLFCWDILPTKIRYQYLRLHKKSDYF